MIQRIQSVWLFLAAMANGALFILRLYAVNNMGVVTHYGVRDEGNFALFLVAAIITLLPLITIFLFRNRKRQIGLSWLTILATVGFLALAVMKASQASQSFLPGATVQYDFGLFLPVLAIFFLIMAIVGIRKDEKLIKSLDRLR